MLAAIEARDHLKAALLERGWLSRCPADFQAAILDSAHWHHWERDETLWLAGAEGGGLMGIAEGLAGLMTGQGEAGSPMGFIARCGFWTGELTVMTGAPRLITAVARTPLTGVIVPFANVRRLLAAEPGWWRWVGLLGSVNGLVATLLAVDLMRPDSRQRIAAILLHISDLRSRPDTEPVETEGLSQEELAAMCALTRHTLRKVLSEFEARGWVETGYRWLCVRDPDALRALLNYD